MADPTEMPVEVVFHPEGVVTVRHVREPHRAVLFFSPKEWAAFTAGVKAGEFDTDALASDSAVRA